MHKLGSFEVDEEASVRFSLQINLPPVFQFGIFRMDLKLIMLDESALKTLSGSRRSKKEYNARRQVVA